MYQRSRDGEAALEMAQAAGTTLTVTSIAPQERTDLACAHCRAMASRWNAQLRVIAHQRLSHAARSVGQVPRVRYLAACGPERQVLAQAARRGHADAIVLPWQRAERLRRALRLSAAPMPARRRCR